MDEQDGRGHVGGRGFQEGVQGRNPLEVDRVGVLRVDHGHVVLS